MSIHKYRLKDGIGWRAIVQVSPTKQISKKFKRKIDAEDWQDQQRQQHRRGNGLISERCKTTVAEFSKDWLERYARPYKEPSSVLRDEMLLKHQILPHLGRSRIADLEPFEVEAWLDRLRKGDKLSPTTCNLALGLLRKMLNDAVRWRIIRFSPIASVRFLPKAERDTDFWTLTEAAKFLDFAESRDRTAYFVYCVALYTGMRRGELRGLLWDCIDFGMRQITVKRSFCEKEGRLKESTKSKRIRRVPINDALHGVLVELKGLAVGTSVLPQDYDFSHAARHLERLANEARVKPIRFHDLRHTFASNFMMGGGSIYDLQKILGHSTIAMTERYSHLAPGHLSGKTDFLDFGTKVVANVTAMRR